jgi:hypothetical protein
VFRRGQSRTPVGVAVGVMAFTAVWQLTSGWKEQSAG